MVIEILHDKMQIDSRARAFCCPRLAGNVVVSVAQCNSASRRSFGTAIIAGAPLNRSSISEKADDDLAYANGTRKSSLIRSSARDVRESERTQLLSSQRDVTANNRESAFGITVARI
jgi:hypothetical protein